LPILQDARRQRLAAARTGFEMGVPFNELNRVLDLGFKPLPWGDQGYVSGKLQRLGDGLKSEHLRWAFNPKAEIRKADTEAPSRIGRGEEPPMGTNEHEGGTRGAADETGEPTQCEIFKRAEQWFSGLARHESLIPEHDSSLSGSQASAKDAQLASRLRRFLFEQRGRVLQRLSAVAQTSESAVSQVSQPAGAANSDGVPATDGPPTGKSAIQQAGNLRYRTETLLEGIFELTQENDQLAQRLAGLRAPEEKEVDLSQPAVSPPRPAAAWVTAFNEGIRAGVLDTLREGFSRRDHPADLAARVKAFYNQNTERLLTQAAELARGEAPASSSSPSTIQ